MTGHLLLVSDDKQTQETRMEAKRKASCGNANPEVNIKDQKAEKLTC